MVLDIFEEFVNYLEITPFGPKTMLQDYLDDETKMPVKVEEGLKQYATSDEFCELKNTRSSPKCSECLRKADYSGIVDAQVKLHGSLSTGDKTAIRKNFSGLVKLLYPDKIMTGEQIIELLDFAVEGRKRVKDQLYIFDETFRVEPVEFTYIINSIGRKVTVETREKSNYFTELTDKQLEIHTGVNEDKPFYLTTKQISIKDNQTGISYKKLFAEYLKGSKQITVTDPYIRYMYQFRNFLEFCVMLGKNKEVDEEIDLHLVTWSDVQFMRESISNLKELQENLVNLGINLTYEFQKLHDRHIVANNGWKINLRRGLDIFERRESKLVIGDIDQESRKCKNCEIIFVRV